MIVDWCDRMKEDVVEKQNEFVYFEMNEENESNFHGYLEKFLIQWMLDNDWERLEFALVMTDFVEYEKQWVEVDDSPIGVNRMKVFFSK